MENNFFSLTKSEQQTVLHEPWSIEVRNFEPEFDEFCGIGLVVNEVFFEILVDEDNLEFFMLIFGRPDLYRDRIHQLFYDNGFYHEMEHGA